MIFFFFVFDYNIRYCNILRMKKELFVFVLLSFYDFNWFGLPNLRCRNMVYHCQFWPQSIPVHVMHCEWQICIKERKWSTDYWGLIFQEPEVGFHHLDGNYTNSTTSLQWWSSFINTTAASSTHTTSTARTSKVTTGKLLQSSVSTTLR